jgi:hypothetical protein
MAESCIAPSSCRAARAAVSWVCLYVLRPRPGFDYNSSFTWQTYWRTVTTVMAHAVSNARARFGQRICTTELRAVWNDIGFLIHAY